MPEYAGHKMSKKDLKNFHKDMKDMAKKEKPMSEKELNDMAKEYNKEAMEVYTSYLDELKTSTLTSYKKKAKADKEAAGISDAVKFLLLKGVKFGKRALDAYP